MTKPARDSRPVHYHAHGRKRGYRFACYDRERDTWIASKREEPRTTSDGRTYQHVTYNASLRPRRFTDLRRVTCRACWVEIVKLGRAAIGSSL